LEAGSEHLYGGHITMALSLPAAPHAGDEATPWSPLVVNAARCKGCELCIVACSKGVLALDLATVNALGYHPVMVVAPERCTSDAFCARVCPDAVFTVFAPRKEASR
jgi:2-oxoglutarate ferredoxin oxidoreductase subunit delta